jgi:hypothetical protein
LFHNASGSRSTTIRLQANVQGIGRSMRVNTCAASGSDRATCTPFPPQVPSCLSTTVSPIRSNHARRSSADCARLVRGARMRSSCATSCNRSRLSTTPKCAAAPRERSMRGRNSGRSSWSWCNCHTTPSSQGITSFGHVAAITLCSVLSELTRL